MAKLISPHDIVRAEFAQQQYRVTLKPGFELEDALNPASWSISDRALKQYDRIQIVHEDGSFYAEAIVKAPPPKLAFALLFENKFSETGSQTPVARKVTIPDPANDIPAGYEAKFAPKTHWRVIRVTDGQELVRDLANRDEAVKWAKENLV